MKFLFKKRVLIFWLVILPIAFYVLAQELVSRQIKPVTALPPAPPSNLVIR